MKNINLLFITILLFAFISCDKEEKDDKNKDQEQHTETEFLLQYGGKEYTSIKEVTQEFYGDEYNTNTHHISLRFYLPDSDNEWLVFNIFTPSTSKKLVEGSYYFNNTKEEMSLYSGRIFLKNIKNEEGEEIYPDIINSGNIAIITIKDDMYELEITCNTNNEKYLKLFYKGKITWIDEEFEYNLTNDELLKRDIVGEWEYTYIKGWYKYLKYNDTEIYDGHPQLYNAGHQFLFLYSDEIGKLTYETSTDFFIWDIIDESIIIQYENNSPRQLPIKEFSGDYFIITDKGTDKDGTWEIEQTFTRIN